MTSSAQHISRGRGGDTDYLPKETDGKPVIGVTHEQGVISFVVGNPIEDVSAYFEDVTEAIDNPKEMVVTQQATGRSAILVVSDMAEALQSRVRQDSH